MIQGSSDSLAKAEAKAESVIGSFASVLNALSAFWLSIVAIVILYDVVGREMFDTPFYGTNEIVSNSVLSILMLQLPLSILERRSLRTTIVFDNVGLRGKSYIDAISYMLAGLLFLAIAVGSWPNMIEGWEILEQEGSGIIEIPVYPIRTLVVVVSIISVIVCTLLTYHALVRPEDFNTSDMADPAE
ncbi:MAG: TRAP transporter small permease [Rhodospirillales bacterium]|nr:TRAP transporter small permease [Rhodospirillales bacterium]